MFDGGGATACVKRGQCGVRVLNGELVRLPQCVWCVWCGEGSGGDGEDKRRGEEGEKAMDTQR